MVAKKSDSGQWYRGQETLSDLRCALVVSEFNPLVTERLLQEARSTLEQQGVNTGQLTVAWVPGALELPLAAKRLAVTGRYEVIICLGAIIRGETSHYELVSEATARGISQVSLDTGIPVIFGVVTAETVDQALERARPGSHNRGRQAACAAIKMASVIRQIK